MCNNTQPFIDRIKVTLYPIHWSRTITRNPNDAQRNSHLDWWIGRVSKDERTRKKKTSYHRCIQSATQNVVLSIIHRHRYTLIDVDTTSHEGRMHTDMSYYTFPFPPLSQLSSLSANNLRISTSHVLSLIIMQFHTATAAAGAWVARQTV